MASIWVGKVEVSWDESKAASNLKKHGISFLEAATAFEDNGGIYSKDEESSDDEKRYLLIGVSQRRKILVVVHVERKLMAMRIISARHPTSEERSEYEQEQFGRRRPTR